jgi:hypothetical protein
VVESSGPQSLQVDLLKVDLLKVDLLQVDLLQVDLLQSRLCSLTGEMPARYQPIPLRHLSESQPVAPNIL